MYAGNTGVVPIIAPLNESVSYLIELSFNGQFLFERPAGFSGQDVMDATKQVRCSSHLSTSMFLTFVCLVSTGMIVMETFGMLEKITEFFSFTHDLFVLFSSFPFGTSQQSNVVVMIHDAFQPISYWDGFMSPPNWRGVMIDTHIYQMFSVAVCLKLFFFASWLIFPAI